MADTQSRKWQITINNPIEKGFSHDKIKEVLQEFKTLIYWCMSDEIGENGTFHTHIYLHSKNAIRFSVMHNRFEGGHFEMARGTSLQNRDYVFKQGKWANTDKEDTNIKDSHEESGECPVERQGARNDISDLYDMIKDGLTNYEILEQAPQYLLNIEKIDRVRQTVLDEKFKDTWRELTVEYIWGLTGTGKTRSVMEKYGYSNVYRVTDYMHPFDSYKGQDVIVFEEFRSSLYLDDMLKYLDGYPVEFPARYSNKQACFTKVYIISNIDLRSQYPNVQRDEVRSWEAFLRRIHSVTVFTGEAVVRMETQKYLKEYYPFLNSPFEEK